MSGICVLFLLWMDLFSTHEKKLHYDKPTQKRKWPSVTFLDMK